MHNKYKKNSSGGVKVDDGLSGRVKGESKVRVGSAGSISRGGRKSAHSVSRGK